MSRSPGRYGGGRSPRGYVGDHHGGYGSGYHRGYGSGHHGGYGGYAPGYGLGAGLALGTLGGLAIGSAISNPYTGYSYSAPYGALPYVYPSNIYYDQPEIIVPIANSQQLAQLAAQNPGRPISFLPSSGASPVVNSVSPVMYTTAPTIQAGPANVTSPIYVSPYRF